MTDQDDYLSDLVERLHQIEQLTAQPGWALLEDYLKAETVAHQNRLLSGRIDSLDEYKRLTGWLDGVFFYRLAAKRLRDQIAGERGRIAEDRQPA